MKVFVNGNYLIFEGERKTFEFAMKWTIFRYNQTTKEFIINEFNGGTLRISESEIQKESITDENGNPFSFKNFYGYLLNYTGQ
jgi:hypothetical protein